MPEPTSIAVKHEGCRLVLTFTSCRVSMAGGFAGNVEIDVACDPDLHPALIECLRLENPGEDTTEAVIATGDAETGLSLVFHSEAIERLAEAPRRLTLLWGDEPITSLESACVDSIPVARVHRTIDPAEILPTPTPTATRESAVRLSAERESVWLIPAFLLALAGVALIFAPDGLALEDIAYRELAGLVAMALGAVVGGVGVRIPYRQIWFDRDHRRLSIVAGRTLSVESARADAPQRGIADFSHVRVCERHYAPGRGDDPDSDRQEWLVSLEGPIPYADADGRVHSRSDALVLSRFASGRRARHFAARVAVETGLRILEATDW